MEIKKFRKIFVATIMTLLIGTSFVPLISGNTNNSSDSVVITVDQSGENIEITYDINDFIKVPVEINGIEYSIINIGEESNLLFAGKPDIPSICRSIVIPDTAQMKINVLSTTYKEYYNVLIAPSKGNLLRTVNPDDVPFEFGEVYNQDSWFPGNIANLREPYILRDFRGQVVEIYPIQYNPVKKIMRFYTDITVEVAVNGQDTINCIYRAELPEKVVSDFNSIYQNHFINFGDSGRYTPVEEQGNMLIITYDDFWDEMVPYLEWKNMKGIPTEMVKVSEIGNADAIKTYITNYYNDNGLTFVLLVGDAAQVPTLIAGYAASDPSYTYVVGNDHYPDLFIGRFSAQNSDQLNTQIERSLEYERDPQLDAEWYHKGIGIGSDQGQGIGDEGQADWQHMRILRELLINYIYTDINELYDGNHAGEDDPGNPSATMVSEAVNDGRSIINYCGHGSPTSWGTTGFGNNDINNLVNYNMLPYVTCVACNNGQFNDYDACFCEAWLRATKDGEPTGAIVATGSSVSMSWAPPMDAQDEFVDLIVETYENNVKHTFGGIHYNGLMHMNDDYGSGGYAETDYWHLFGDPSLQIRTDTPVEMIVDRDSEIEEDATFFEVTVEAVEGALCALSRNGELLGYSYTDESGYALIELNVPVTGEEPLDIVVTAYNKIPYIVELPVHTNDPPEIPNKPSGETNLKVNTSYEYITSTTDPDGNDVFYMWDWGDGSFSDWEGPYLSGETASTSHSWTEPANCVIKVKAKDTNDKETDWSEGLQITVIKNKALQKPFLQNLFEKFPNIYVILRYFLGL
jgi:hypothetical protein